jgi:DNA-binding MarR family transcriptional regulator
MVEEAMPAKKTVYSEQIIRVVHNFVQMWVKFEQLLHDELVRTQTEPLKKNSVNGERIYANYTLVYRVSSAIYPDRRLTMGELSRSLSVPLSTATRLANWLVDNGFVERSSDPSDRRVVRVSLTAEGKDIHEKIENYTGERLRQTLSCLTPDEQTMLFALIGRVAKELKKMT